MKGQPITTTLYKAHNQKWFDGKTALTLRDLIGSNGELIRKGEVVIIRRKRLGFTVISESGLAVWHVPCDALELL